MTAAHCWAPWLKTVRIGAHDISIDEPTRTTHKIAKYHIHEKYDFHADLTDYDFLMLELEEPITFSKEAKAIRLPSPGDNQEQGVFNEDTIFVASGWGKTSFPGVHIHPKH